MKQLSRLAQLLPLLSIALISSSAVAQQGVDLARAAATELAKELGDQEQVTYQEAARSYFDWGAIIRPSGEVLSVREGSVAATMGLQVNDQVTHINQFTLTGNSVGEVLQYLAGLPHASELTAKVKRDGETITLSGQVLATVVPGWRLHIELPRRDIQVGNLSSSQGCGRLSVFLAPNLTDYYPAQITSINGENYQSLNPNVVLPVGEHVIGVSELIDGSRALRGRMLRQEKLISVVIEANQKYHLGAHYISENRYQRLQQGWWEPAVWKVTEHSCSLND
ncbi:MAG: Uncharacterised protein [Pseudidiomarina mangrovi]|nr:MAG: Uncharacterised protein [Pseudidiomarina mangrovi]